MSINKVIPFRWNIEKYSEFQALIPDGKNSTANQWLLDNLLESAAKILTFAGDAHLYFVGRSPESYHDLLKGIFYKTIFQERFSIFQFSARFTSIKYLNQKHPYAIDNLYYYMQKVGICPTSILHRKGKTVFVDLVDTGSTFEFLIKLLQFFAAKEKIDWKTIQEKIGIIGILKEEKTSPNTWRWQQDDYWKGLLKQRNIKNVTIDPYFWGCLGNWQNKVTVSFGPKRWSNPIAQIPVRKKENLNGLQTGHLLFKAGLERSNKKVFKKYLANPKAMQFAHVRNYLSVL